LSTDQVGVLYANQPSSSEPTYSISRADARALKASGQGFFVNHGKDIRLLAVQELDAEKLISSLKARDRSAQMPPSITEQYVDGHRGAVAIVEAWA
jgi:hypothetical protein